MNILILIALIFEIIFCMIMVILLTRLFLSTRYRPIIFLASFFVIFAFSLIIYVPVLGITDLSKARIFLDISILTSIGMLPLLILFLEGIKGNSLSLISAGFISYTAFIIGYCSVPRWDYVFGNGIWEQSFYLDITILAAIQLILCFTLFLFRFIEFALNKEVTRPKKMPIIAIIGACIILIGMSVGTLLKNPIMDYISLLIGSCIMGGAFLWDPNSFFLSNTEIQVIMMINNKTLLPYFAVGKTEGTSSSLAAAGLAGAICMLQDILFVEKPPNRLMHADKEFLIESDLKNNISAILIVNQINNGLRAPLKQALSIFVKKFEPILHDWDGLLDRFKPFKDDLLEIFSFAISTQARDILK